MQDWARVWQQRKLGRGHRGRWDKQTILKYLGLTNWGLAVINSYSNLVDIKNTPVSHGERRARRSSNNVNVDFRTFKAPRYIIHSTIAKLSSMSPQTQKNQEAPFHQAHHEQLLQYH